MSGSESLKRIFFGNGKNPKVDGHERLPGISTVAGGSTGYPGRRSSRFSGSDPESCWMNSRTASGSRVPRIDAPLLIPEHPPTAPSSRRGHGAVGGHHVLSRLALPPPPHVWGSCRYPPSRATDIRTSPTRVGELRYIVDVNLGYFTSPTRVGELKRGSRFLFRREHSSGVSFPVSSMVATYPVRPSEGMRFTRNGFGFEKIS